MLIQVIMLDCFQRMEWIGPRLCVGEPCEIVHRMREQLFAVDHNILEDLPPGASTQVKRRRLTDLKSPVAEDVTVGEALGGIARASSTNIGGLPAGTRGLAGRS